MPVALGLQVHRSSWVAERAVQSAKRGSRRWQLAIEANVSVPVSNSYVLAVRERGWLKRKGGA
ncbi:MAG: LytTR family transcriptional regulator DNA-binding domain-containing protein [Pseudomonadota bacterium]